MVATRRHVPTDTAEEMAVEDPDLILKKKPVRKAAAAKATTTKTAAAKGSTRGKKAEPEAEPEVSKPKTTRSKKTELDDAPELAKPAVRKPAGRAKKDVEEPAVEVDEVVEVSKPTKPIKAGSVRGRKPAATAEETEAQPKPAARTGTLRGRKAAPPVNDEEAQEANPTRSTTTGSMRGKKATASAPVLAAPAQPKQTRQTRGAAVKAAPLSPKKITQVSKTQTRTSKSTNPKAAAKAPAAAPPKSTARGRRRAESDENADLPLFDLADEQDDDVVMLASTPAKTRSRNVRNVSALDSEASMSSRPTTPNDSAAQSFEQVEEVDELQADTKSVSERDEDTDQEGDVSEDVLCGPKTPMKRLSLGAEARYHESAQRTIRKYEAEVRKEQTPARRFVVLGSQRGTPQTQKPYCKPVPPSSDFRPMTVGRAAGRAFVFKALSDGAPALAQDRDEDFEEEEPSFLPDDDIIPVDDTPVPNGSHDDYQLPVETEMEAENYGRKMSVSVHESEEDFVVPADVQRISDGPEDTVLIHDDEYDIPSPMEQPGASFEIDDTVIITRRERTQDDEMVNVDEHSENGSVLIHSVPGSPDQSINAIADQDQHAIIQVNFDKHLNQARVSQVDTQNMKPEASFAVTSPLQEEFQAVAGAEMDFELLATADRGVDERTADYTAKTHSDVPVEDDFTRRQTVNFNDFINAAAMADPTEVLNLAQVDHVEHSAVEAVEHEKPEEDLADDIAMVDVLSHSQDEIAEDHADEDYQAEAIFELAASPTLSAALADVINEDEPQQIVPDAPVPHYARPTIAFERRKSLPAFNQRTPVKSDARPNTSDGASMPKVANPFTDAWWSRPRRGSTVGTPVKSRPSTAHGAPTPMKFNTPTKRQSQTPMATPKERYPVFAPRQNYVDHSSTVAAPVRFQTPGQSPPKRRETFHKAIPGKVTANRVQLESAVSTPKAVASPQATPRERFPRLKPRQDYEEHAQTVAAPVRFQTPATKSPKRRETFHKAMLGNAASTTASESVQSTSTPVETPVQTPQATPNERYPRLRPREGYEEHAKTVAAPVRFRTPRRSPARRSATAQKPDTLHKAALKANMHMDSHTPMKTPLKAPAMTPSQAPMTPHPSVPLRGVFAMVEVFTLEGASASAPFIALLHHLGAKTTRSWSERVTHVIFKDGSPTTLQRVRLNNKEFEEKSTGKFVHCVNSRWVTDCDTQGARMDESDEAYAVDIEEVPRGGKRRRKSMEPSALMNLGGNIVRDRKSSAGRVSSFGRASMKPDSPAQGSESLVEAASATVPEPEKENSADEQSSPATPAWIAAPGKLVQQTAPMKRVRMLDLPGKEAKSRRLTFWNGAQSAKDQDDGEF